MPPRLYVDPRAGAHVTGPGHPERQGRIDACLRALREAKVPAEVVHPEPAPRTALERVHSSRYLDGLEAHCRRGGGPLDPDTYAGPESFEIARRGAGACVEATALAVDDGTRSFCLVRPPGHHAAAARPMGFCLLDSAAVGAASAIGAGLRTVAVVDFDVHHGNGTQEIFWRDPAVLYVSVHQWPWYPWYAGALEEIGEGGGEGANVNVPLPAGSGDAALLGVMDRIVGPVLRAFGPELLVVSAGYDAHALDPLSTLEVTAPGFGHVVHRLVVLAAEVCGGRIVMTLEGGYDLEGLSSSFVETMRVLGGAEPSPLRDAELDPDSPPALELEKAVAFHRGRWPL